MTSPIPGPQVAHDVGRPRTAHGRRIEILRGNEGTVYGSGSFDGVVTITTSRATEAEPTTSATADQGSYNTLPLATG